MGVAEKLFKIKCNIQFNFPRGNCLIQLITQGSFQLSQIRLDYDFHRVLYILGPLKVCDIFLILYTIP